MGTILSVLIHFLYAFPISIEGVETKDLKMPPELGEHNEEVICEWLNQL